jgi:protein phosphatase
MSAFAVTGGYRLSWASRTDVGKVRRVNEDSLLTEPGLFVVADGMGGHAAGDVASQLTVASFAGRSLGADLLALTELADVVEHANAVVIGHAHDTNHEGMGSTVVGAAVVDNGGDSAIVVFHVGDSRCYVSENGRLRQVTHDHSQVQEMVDGGEITASQAAVHPYRNVVTRAVGIEPSVVADFVVLPPAQTRRLFLCSDGVSGEVSFDDMERLLAADVSPQDAADSLMSLALSGRASDNATLIVVDIVSERWEDGVTIDTDVTGPHERTRVDRPSSEMIADVPLEPGEVDSPSDSGVEIIDEVPTQL